ncbi:MAG: riboflavin synthase [Flavobacteriales bacterium TMED288]|nr:riboflavin synthase [Flavobacteriales bacterium]RPG53846.1 MAG: riboflavin synthase [Flavobacteriales bacterium TMED288]
MFTGIIEDIGLVKELKHEKGNLHITIKSSISNELKIDQSISHNGVCLTVVNCDNKSHTVTAINETLSKTNLKYLKIGDLINLERCLKLGSRIDGHIVQGHVDKTAICTNISDKNGSWEFTFQYNRSSNFETTIPKGSVTLNGISLTVVKSISNEFSTHIIPYTYENTNMKMLKIGDKVNIEFDIIGKYLAEFNNQNVK